MTHETVTTKSNGYWIPGLPSHVKVIRLDKPKRDEFVFDGHGDIRSGERYANSVMPILKPNNVYGAFDLTKIDIPAGYQRAGTSQDEWLREPQANEQFISANGYLSASEHRLSNFLTSGADTRRIIVCRKTRRVLVHHEEFDIVDDSEKHVTGVNTTLERANALAQSYAPTWSIEERPVT